MAIGLGTLGFLKGASTTALDSIQQREKDEREEKKLQLLEQMRRETAKYVADYEDLLANQRVDDDLTDEDFTTGKRTLRNRRGEVLGTTDISASDRQKYQMGLDQASLTQEATRANIDQSRASAASSRAYASSLDSKNDKDDEISDADVANELMYRYSDDINEIQRSLAEGDKELGLEGPEANSLSRTQIRRVALEMSRNARTGEQAQEMFLNWLENARTGKIQNKRRQRIATGSLGG